MSSSYMAISSLTYMLGFSVHFFFQPIYTKIAYFEREKITLKSFAQKLELKLSLIQDGCHFGYY
jgi:hypothetical protein